MTWEVTQWERSDLAGERGRERKAAIMCRANASDVGLRQREAERIKKERKKKEIITLQFACGDEKERWKKGERTGVDGTPHSLIPSTTALPGMEM